MLSQALPLPTLQPSGTPVSEQHWGMNTEVGAESARLEALQLLEGPESALEVNGHRAFVNPRALPGMLGLLCWEQLFHPQEASIF